MDKPKGFQFAIDRGGTFTDVFARCPNGKVRVMKLLSVDPQNYDDAPREAIRRILQEETGNALDKDGKVNSSLIESIRMGTTVATNALLERKGAKMALVINKGFKDLLYIGNQARPHIFHLNIKRPSVLYTEVVEVDCRVIPALEDRCQIDKSKLNWKEVYGTTGQKMLVMKDVDEEAVRKDLTALREKGIDSIAVVLAHSYTYREHELKIGKIAQQLGFNQVSLSHSVTSMVRMAPRGYTACADGYLTPHIREYVKGFASGFTDGLKNSNVLFMQSDGGLTPMSMFNGSRAVLSGPAGGVVGYALTSYQKETNLPVIGFDMGGTSTDVSRYAGALEHVHEATTAGVTIQAPQLDINTVAAGGGSMLMFRSGLFVAGPESAGAEPGPACYRKGGPLTVTDANLLLGRLLPEYFPKIFGPNENEPLDRDATVSAFRKLTDEINSYLKQDGGKAMTMEEVAMGFIDVANEAMCRPIRALTTARGYDARAHALASFGGAGAQHACAVARRLAVPEVLVHKYAGILSAYGMALADVVEEAQEPSALVYCSNNFEKLDMQLDKLAAVCKDKLRAQGFTDSQIVVEPYLHLRYSGTDCALMVSPSREDPHSTRHGDFYTAFIERYKNEFGFTLSARDVLVDDVRVRAAGRSAVAADAAPPSGRGTDPSVEKIVKVYFEGGYQDTAIYLLEKLKPEQKIPGPAIIMDSLSTILIEPGSCAEITKYGDIRIIIGAGQTKVVTSDLDTVQLSIFSHRFMSIAEQMGRVLQRTSISVNIKERLDFSCALFGPDGGLVSNAPHIPVHLGAMQETVQYQMKVRGDSIKPGDVLLANHPKAGGSHLPDLTVITPVFHKRGGRPIFFVASRGHHADVGGLTPGSMPPHSVRLKQEGAAFRSLLLVERGRFNEDQLVAELMKPGKEPGCSGTRNLADNLSDLKAQVAANQRGIQLVSELIEEYTLDVVQAYMTHIQKNAELAVRDMLKEIAKNAVAKTGSAVLKATEYMDNGTPIVLTVTLDKDLGSAVCDFTGTGVEVWGNLNAPRAITLSALIYCLRCMVGHDVPLNQGCLNPVQVIIPAGSILDPSEDAAVVGGNVLTSQRIVDVVLKAFQVCAASQGCMNNLTLGEDDWGYYETVAGGSGAGPGWRGCGGVHTHMTNTRITDVEIVETRYPLLVSQFSLRAGSGGRGQWDGGDGVTRELLFRRTVQLSVLTERRAFQPYGMNGGEPGERGLNLLQRADGRLINLGAKSSVVAYPGDKYIMNSPGGGGYGRPSDAADTNKQTDKQYSEFLERGSVYEYRSAQESV
ncbi:5-oxoprolinase [Vanessa atalanta]|uniref:5-oxoprolinase n=1 Tax=Vanessa atalanta TaxID=42275 RepID=UPI001FCD48BD|nr:5-oxoprolinase [Vanessa atalanta]